jgi:DNA-binding response OmpR family regulator
MAILPNHPNAGRHILIAEDSPTQAIKLQFLLEQAGFLATVARNGEEALESARKSPPDLLITDIMMPKMNGYELARSFRRDTGLCKVPIILLTTLSDPHDIILGLECGADNFIRKPYNDEYLLQRVSYILTNKALRQSEKVQMGIEIDLSGQRHFITAERQQIFDLLISTYEEAVHLNRSLELSNQSLNGLFRVAEGLNQCTMEADVLERVLERVLELPSVSAGWIFARDSSGDFHIAAVKGNTANLRHQGAEDEECECLRRIVQGSAEYGGTGIRCEMLSGCDFSGFSSTAQASIPLWVNAQQVALLNLASATGRPFTEDELKVLHGVGHQAGLALERARLHVKSPPCWITSCRRARRISTRWIIATALLSRRGVVKTWKPSPGGPQQRDFSATGWKAYSTPKIATRSWRRRPAFCARTMFQSNIEFCTKTATICGSTTNVAYCAAQMGIPER